MKRQVYLNQKQVEFAQAQQKTKLAIWGRGTGKSTMISAIHRQRLKHLPRAKGFLSSTTYNQISTKTLPAIKSMWESMGLKQDVHYVTFKKPPKSFGRPHQQPDSFKNVITFFNGYTIECLSMDRPDLARGGSYDFGDVDEAALIKQEDLSRVLIASIRGNKHRFNHYLHQGLNLYTSMPWKSTGKYLLEYEQKAELEAHKFYYSEANVYDNVDILGLDGINRMKDTMTYLDFEIECLNRRITKVADMFYHAFDEVKNIYSTKYQYDDQEEGITTQGRHDIRPDALLDISLDFSGWFNCMTIWQPKHDTDNCVDSMYVKGNEKLKDLIEKFAIKYAGHEFKYVRIWGEPRGHNRRANSTETLFQEVQRILLDFGWQSEIFAPKVRTMNHADRYIIINDRFENKKLMINDDNKSLIIAINSTAVKDDYTKDKSSEKDRSFPQEHAPHLTDTVDYYIVYKSKPSKSIGMAGSVSFR